MKKFLRLGGNIALGMFVNSLYGLTNGNFSWINVAIMATSILGMGICAYFEKGD